MIDACTAVGPANREHLELLLETARQTADNLRWLLCIDPLANPDDFRPLVEKYNCTLVDPPENLRRPGSGQRYVGHRHASNLNALVAAAQSDTVIVCDVDVVWLKKGWVDDITRPLAGKCAVCGTEPVNDDSWRGWPNPAALAFKKSVFTELGIDFSKPHPPEWAVVDEANQKLWNRDIGTKVYMEVACQIPLKLSAAGYTAAVLPPVDMVGPSGFFGTAPGQPPLVTHMTMSRHFGPFEQKKHVGQWWRRTRYWAEQAGITLGQSD